MLDVGKSSIANRGVIAPLALALLVSAVCWGIVFAALPPESQNLPLGDDWAFCLGALEFAKGHGIHYFQWASMPQLGQWLWAAPFLRLLSEELVALRLSTILLSWIGLGAFYDLLRVAGRLTPLQTAFAVAALALNPLFFLLQGTFMTDVPSLSFALVAMAFYTRALASGRPVWLLPAFVVGIVAGITRQNTAAVPVVAGILIWRSPKLRLRPEWWTAVILPFIVAVLTHQWFEHRPDITHVKRLQTPTAMLLLPFLIVHLCGLSVLPLIALNPAPRSWKRFGISAVALLTCAAYWWALSVLHPSDPYLAYGGSFPYCTGVLGPWGAFSKWLVMGERELVLNEGTRAIVSVLGCFAGAWLLDRLLDKLYRHDFWSDPILLLGALQIPLVMMLGNLFDRYVLFFLPAALYVAAEKPSNSRSRLLPAMALLLGFGLVSVGLMHDWLAWNSARWALGRRAVHERGIDPKDIEGGFEWNGWHAPAPRRLDTASPQAGLVLKFTQDYFPHVTGRYALSFSEMPGTVVVDSEPYPEWLSPGQKRFLLIQPAPKGVSP
jgi:Dolichyl-phosphate-mannose-protein mannosyltransferase